MALLLNATSQRAACAALVASRRFGLASIMAKRRILSIALVSLSISLACSGDDGMGTMAPEGNAPASAAPAGGSTGSPPTMESPAAATGQGVQPGAGTEQTVVPANPPSMDSAMTAGAAGALQPALPVLENADHDQLLASAVPELAANKRLVYDMWRTLIEARDTEAAEQYIAEGYIQHNPNADTGRAGVLAFFASLGAPLVVQDRVQAKLVAIVAERDYVAMVRVDEYTQPRPYTTTWFDLFRIEAGLIAEHWDHGRLPADGTPADYVPPTESADQADQEAALVSADPALATNKRLVYDMWRTLLDGQQVEEAPRFLAEGYVQHNPQANTGLSGFLDFFRRFAQPRPVEPTVANFIQMIAEDDLVVLATLRSYDASGAPYTTTWFDMFRVSGGLLVEHWDTATLQ
jgi:predicted SnoaL-like aldol condensation-catalyzing enzyme